MATPRRALLIVLGLMGAAFVMLLLLCGGSFYFFLKHDVPPTVADRALLITASDVVSLGREASLRLDCRSRGVQRDLDTSRPAQCASRRLNRPGAWRKALLEILHRRAPRVCLDLLPQLA